MKITLTDKQEELLKFIYAEKTNEEIALLTDRSIRTVENNRLALMGKVGTKTTVGLIKYGLRRGIIKAPRKKS